MEDGIDEQACNLHGTKTVLIGLVIGSLAGAAAMLPFAPQSGIRTRAQIRRKSIQLRDRTASSLKDGLEQARVIATRSPLAFVRRPGN